LPCGIIIGMLCQNRDEPLWELFARLTDTCKSFKWKDAAFFPRNAGYIPIPQDLSATYNLTNRPVRSK
jgi:hypothetical protein